MKLRTKLVVSVISIAILAGMLLFAGAYVILTRNFTHLEKEEMLRDIERVNRAIESRLSSLSATVIDWSAWDETYDYVGQPHQQYIEDNLSDSVFEYMHINLIAIIGQNGDIVTGKSYDLANHQEVPFSAAMQTLLAASAISRHATPESSYQGFLRSPDGPLLFASYPILTSEGEGPVRGTLIMACYLDQRMLQELSEITLLPISMNLLSSGDGGGPTPSNTTTVSLAGNRLIAGRTYIADELGNPYVELVIELPRSIYIHGTASLLWLGLGIAAGTVVFAALGLFALDRLLLNRLAGITDAVDSIGKGKNLALRVPEQGRDEIRELSANLNFLLDSLELSQGLLGESLERFQMANRATSDAIWEWNLKTNAFWGNDQFFKLFGYSTEETGNIIEAWLSHIHGEDRPRIWRGVNQAIECGDEIWADHYRFLRKDGSLADIEDRGYIMRGAGEEPVRMIGAMQDVTGRNKTQREYRTLFSEMLEGFALHEIICDEHGRPVDYRFLQINPAFERMTGLKAEDILGKTVLELLPGTEKHWIETYGQVALTGQPVHFDHYSGKFGRHFEVTAFRPAPGQFACMFTDVTERKLAEAEARQLREKAEVSNRLAVIGEMAAGIAHEINNPLTGVIGFSELLLSENLPPEIRENVQIIADSGRRMKNIIKRMLMFSRQTKPMRTSVNIHDLIDSTLEIRAYVLKTGNIEVVKRYDSGLPWVTVDPGQIQQVLLNLIINAEYAINKAGDRGTLTITTRRGEGYVEIVVKDDGIGMTSETRAKLFQPFFTTKEVGEGTGLGLSLSRSILLEHGGSIDVLSQPGEGTELTILLPVTSQDEKIMEPPPPAYHSSPEGFKPLRVMVVDDEEGVRRLIRTILEQNGHAVEAFDDPVQALAELDEKCFDIVLLDVRMPKMGGVEFFTRAMRKNPELSGRVIFITGDTLGAGVREFLEKNLLPYVNKPFDSSTLMAAVNSLSKSVL